MWASFVIVRDPGLDLLAKMVLAQWNQEIQTATAERPNSTLANRVRLWRSWWRSWWRFQYPKPQVSNGLIQRSRENRIAIMDEKAIRMIGRNRFT